MVTLPPDPGIPGKITRRSRPDRAAKLKARKEVEETVVKSCLRKHVRGDAETKNSVVDALCRRVDAYSQRIGFASVALQSIVKDAFHGIDDVRQAVLPPDLFEQTFVRQLMLGTGGDTLIPSPAVVEFFARHPELAPTDEHRRFQGDSNIYSAGAIKLLTNVKNSLIVNFERRVRRFARDFMEVEDLSEGDRAAMVHDILGWPGTMEFYGCCYPQPKAVFDVVREQRSILGLADGARIGKAWFRAVANLPIMLRHAASVLRFQETHGLDKFSITPICRVRRHFVTIDTSVLYGIAKELSIVGDKCNYEAFEAMANDHWRSIFDIDRLAGFAKTFTRTIETDGTSLCVHFTRPKGVVGDAATSNAPALVDNERFRYVGIDPGRENIFFAAERLAGNKVKTWRLSRKEYYRASGAHDAICRSNRWNNNVRSELQRLAEASPKGLSLERHLEFVAAFVDTFPALWNEYSKKRWAEQRLRLYGGKKRVFANFFERIRRADPSREVVVAYGSARYAPGGRFELSVPTSRAFKECQIRFRAHAVDEYRTTMVHHADDSILKRVGIRKRMENWQKKATKVSRDLLWCGSTGNCKFVNRDKNAAVNILRCLTAPTRPLALKRTPDKRAIQHVVKKVIF